MSSFVCLREGYNVWTDERSRAASLSRFKKLGVITLESEDAVICKRCKSTNLVDPAARSDGVRTCSTCGKALLMTRSDKQRLIVKSINKPRIIQIVNNVLMRILGKSNVIFAKETNSWNCQIDGNAVPVFVSQASSSNQYFDRTGKSRWLCLVVDWEREGAMISYYDAIHFLPIESVLEGDETVKESLLALSKSFDPNVGESLEEKFDSFISAVSPTFFERQFVDALLEGLKTRREDLTAYISFLIKMKKTTVNSKVVFLGGPGREDFLIMDLAEYIQEGLKPNRVGEAKRYSGSEFTLAQYLLGEHHAKRSQTTYIVATDNIQDSVWKDIWDTRRTTGYFHQVIFDKSLLLTLIMNVHLQGLLDMRESDATKNRPPTTSEVSSMERPERGKKIQ